MNIKNKKKLAFFAIFITSLLVPQAIKMAGLGSTALTLGSLAAVMAAGYCFVVFLEKEKR